MKSAAGFYYVDVSSDEGTGDADNGPHPEALPVVAALDGADILAVKLGLWASGLRCVIVYALAPAAGALGPLTIGAALVTQVAGTAACLSGAHSLWTRRHRGRCAYALIAALTCLCTLMALLAPAGF
ncbi:hypothetical protein [uncultured Actinomyces sp.]|jgi:hypothetical protein avisC_12477|uniref:hypothetical protein n=1 Tax=uncultured Actinomyces sp. TaxID=249061 RepID=UPI0028D7EA16|nr:hypothetical protein [uncultured Actinomyces sp.]